MKASIFINPLKIYNEERLRTFERDSYYLYMVRQHLQKNWMLAHITVWYFKDDCALILLLHECVMVLKAFHNTKLHSFVKNHSSQMGDMLGRALIAIPWIWVVFEHDQNFHPVVIQKQRNLATSHRLDGKFWHF